MRRRALLASAGIALSAGCGATDGSSATDAGSVPEQLQGTPTAADSVEWTTQLGVADWVASVGDRVVVGLSEEDGHRVVGLDPATGEVSWTAGVAGRPTPRRRDDVVLLHVGGENGRVVVLDPATGDEQWEAAGSLSFHAGTDDRVIVQRAGVESRTVTGRDLTTGERVWRATATRVFPGRGERSLHLGPDAERVVARSVATGERSWEWTGPSWIETAGTEQVNGRHLFAAPDGPLVGLDGANGGVVFHDEMDPLVSKFGTTTGDRVLFGDALSREERGAPGRLSAVDPSSGVAWSQTFDEAAAVHPLPADGVVYGLLQSGAVRALDPASGERLWRRPGLVVGSGTRGLYVARDGRLRALDREGRVRWTADYPVEGTPAEPFPLGDSPGTAAFVARDAVFVGSERGLTVYDAASGRVRTRARIGGPPETAGIAADRLFVAVGAKLHAVSY